MISTKEFKRQIGKPLGQEMRKLGFKGSGFIYKKEDADFLYVVFIGSGRWGGYCSPYLFIHPKRITKDSVGELNLAKLPLHRYKFRMQLFDTPRGERWEFSDDEFENLVSLAEMITVIKERAIPIVERFSQRPGPLDKFTVADLDRTDLSCRRYIGTTFTIAAPVWLAHILAIVFEESDPEKAREFAQFGVAHIEPGDKFFGIPDLLRIAAQG